MTETLQVTTGMLWQGALILAIIDAIYITVLVRLIRPESMRKYKWSLTAATGIFWCIVWTVMVIAFWEPVYSHVFPGWTRWFIPPVYGLMFAGIGLLFWWISVRLPGNPVITLCLLGGLWGALSHIWAVSRGILEKPPMLQGVRPIAAVIMPIFEFFFYWCLILTAAALAWKTVNFRKQT